MAAKINIIPGTLYIEFNNTVEAKEAIEQAIKFLVTSKDSEQKIFTVSFYGSPVWKIDPMDLSLSRLFQLINKLNISSLSFEKTSLEKSSQELFRSILDLCEVNNIKNMDLSRNAFGIVENTQNIIGRDFIKDLANKVQSIDLSLNQLGYYAYQELLDLFKELSKSCMLQRVNLSNNSFSIIEEVNGNMLKPLFEGSLKEICLSNCGLWSLSYKDWIIIRDAIDYSKLNKLDLSNNDIGKECFSSAEDQEGINGILQEMLRNGKLTINLSKNSFSLITREPLQTLNVTTINQRVTGLKAKLTI